jgi:hypothetical protein
MKRSLRSITIGILILLPAILFGQEDIAIGEWKAYVPFKESYDVAQSEDYLYSAAERGILKVAKSDLSIEKITKVEGLSDTEPRHLAYDPLTKTLVIGYANGNIDLMTSDGVVNIPNIFTNSNIVVVKAPNRSRIDDDGKAYLAYNFGLVQLNLESFTFGFSLRTSFEIYDFVKFDGKFFFSSADGIYWADSNPNLNHADLSTWNRFEAGWPVDYSSKSIGVLGDHLFCDLDGDLMEIVNDEPILIKERKENYFIRTIAPLQNVVAVSFEYIDPNPPVFKTDELFFIDENGQDIAEYTTLQCAVVVYNVLQDVNGRIYYANATSLKYFNEIGGGCAEIKTTGPPNTDAFEIAFRGQEVLVASGEISDNGVAAFNRNGLYLYKDLNWDQFNHTDGFFGDTVISYTEIDVSPSGQIAIGTYFEGIILISSDNTSVQLLTDNNSCLDAQSFPVTTISDVIYDHAGNLWISNFRCDLPLKMIDRDGLCRTFPISRSFGTQDLAEIAIDEQGYKWISTFDDNIGVIVFDEGDIEDSSDDQFRVLTAANSAIEANKAWDIKTDLDGDIWLGTERGVVVFECASSIFSNGCNGRRPIVEVEGVAALLLENERVRAVAIDGANRKWFGTTNGIFVQSPNGEEEILRFDERNSPLISNFVRDIAINPKTGEVFISTDKGIMSYRTDATTGDESVHEPESQVFAFPNPVRPDYHGPIAIKGLPRDARVKITDIQGKLVFEGEANGGEAIWNGLDYNGRKATSGVYLVFTTSQTAFEKPDALVSKILIVN